MIHQVGGGRFVVDLSDEEMYTKLYVAATHNRRMLPSFDKELKSITWRQPYQYYEILKCTRHLYDPEYPSKLKRLTRHAAISMWEMRHYQMPKLYTRRKSIQKGNRTGVILDRKVFRYIKMEERDPQEGEYAVPEDEKLLELSDEDEFIQR